jgi:Mg2+ and Co2+ transporter CorA
VSTPAPAAPQWVQVLLSVLGVLGGAGGLAAIAAVVVQRGKFKADAADTLTDVALTLVQPLHTRVAELEEAALVTRVELDATREQVQQLRATVWELRRTLDRWRETILAEDATLRQVRAMVQDGEDDPGRR